jgi:hypothetical protein
MQFIVHFWYVVPNDHLPYNNKDLRRTTLSTKSLFNTIRRVRLQLEAKYRINIAFYCMIYLNY